MDNLSQSLEAMRIWMDRPQMDPMRNLDSWYLFFEQAAVMSRRASAWVLHQLHLLLDQEALLYLGSFSHLPIGLL